MMISVIKPEVVSLKYKGNSCCHHGVTFIELLIVIVIIGVLAGIAMPNFRKTYDNLILDNFVKDLSYLARYLQASAVARNKIYRLDIAQDKDPLEFSAQYQGDDSVFLSIEGRFGKAYKAPSGIAIFSIEPAGRDSIFFYPDSSIDKTTISFQNKSGKKISLAFKGSGTAIEIK